MHNLRVAAISDIHGNRWALEAVMADIRRRGIQHVVNLGDSLYGPLDPRGTVDILLSLDVPTVRGNEDRILLGTAQEVATNPTVLAVQSCLKAEHIHWLESLPLTRLVHQDLLLCHGTPKRDDEYLLVSVTPAGAKAKAPKELEHELAAITAPVLLCGHDHIPRALHLSGDRLIVNPGSVGLPAYTDDQPAPHRMASGTPHARYAILSRSSRRWRFEQILLPYDWEEAATTADRNGRADWASWLRTGRAAL